LNGSQAHIDKKYKQAVRLDELIDVTAEQLKELFGAKQMRRNLLNALVQYKTPIVESLKWNGVFFVSINKTADDEDFLIKAPENVDNILMRKETDNFHLPRQCAHLKQAILSMEDEAEKKKALRESAPTLPAAPSTPTTAPAAAPAAAAGTPATQPSNSSVTILSPFSKTTRVKHGIHNDDEEDILFRQLLRRNVQNNEGVIQIDTGNGKTKSFVHIPKCTSFKSAKANLKPVIPLILDILGGECSAELLEKDLDKGAVWLILALIASKQKEWEHIVENHPHVLSSIQRMTPEYTGAMMTKAKISFTQLRVMAMFMRGHFGAPVFATETSVKGLATSDDNVARTYGTYSFKTSQTKKERYLSPFCFIILSRIDSMCTSSRYHT
jgi:hypothetical protein